MSKIGSESPEKRSQEETARNAQRYRDVMGPQIAAQLHEARALLVKAYRASPRAWPDGIDTKWDRWYRAEEWDDEGKYIGPPINTPEQKADKLAAARAVLGKAEEDLGVKPSVARGRPSLGKPWEAEGISRATYFERKKREAGKDMA